MMCGPQNLIEWAELCTAAIFSIVGILAVYGWMRGDIGWRVK
jgi:hypothetical protein